MSSHSLFSQGTGFRLGPAECSRTLSARFISGTVKAVRSRDLLVPEKEKRPRGRPVVNSTSINLRLAPDLLAWLDEERAKLDPAPSRPEMIRSILERVREM
ncbi:hypothetical protein ORIO_06460 [Cereibacter azotoformans]|uniref:hypothetical protein n=1 Tax=Cereibacter azotoformans TaxID=43057 RepID=UPI001EEC02A4|nr:hypothetical protein [Cereibacter azotoformans]ULB09566.1 hypothetical protein ORIO_06460 [Cereibacter azotoformans]